MSVMKLGESGYEIHTAPEMLPDGRFVCRTIVRRLADDHVEELRPDFDPFATQAEAASAAHIAAVAWVAHPASGAAAR